MAEATTVPWSAAPHTKVKHAIYRQYFGKWLPILVKGFGGGNVTYAEGFAGPGIYSGGEPGSPVIALRALIEDSGLRTRVKDVRFLFVDKDPRCTALLRERVAHAIEPVRMDELAKHGVIVDIETGPCDPTLVELLDKHNAWGRPMLVVLDTWGGSVPLELVRRVAANPSSEVLITIEPQYFVRFADTPNDHGDPRGLEKMKEAMWEVDDVSGFGYRDPRDPDQEVLEIELEPHTGPLKRQILGYLATQPGSEARVEDLRDFALFRTVFKKSQVRGLLVDMVERGQLRTSAPGTSVPFSARVRLP
jgi:three-Cys-motif partner protein